MKKNLMFFLICFVLTVCTGCTKVSYDIEIDGKDRVNISETQAINLSFLKSFDANIEQKLKDGFQESAAEFRKEGYNVSEYKDNTYVGITRSKEGIRFEDSLNAMPEAFQKNKSNVFEVSKGFFKRSYKIHLIVDFQDVMAGMSGDSGMTAGNMQTGAGGNEPQVVSSTKEVDAVTGEVVETKTYTDGTVAEIRYDPKTTQQLGNALGEMPGVMPVADLTIKIPVKAVRHNAAKVAGDNEYQWNLAQEEPVEIVLEYEKGNFPLGILISLLVIGFLIFCIKGLSSSQTSKTTSNVSISGL